MHNGALLDRAVEGSVVDVRHRVAVPARNGEMRSERRYWRRKAVAVPHGMERSEQRCWRGKAAAVVVRCRWCLRGGVERPAVREGGLRRVVQEDPQRRHSHTRPALHTRPSQQASPDENSPDENRLQEKFMRFRRYLCDGRRETRRQHPEVRRLRITTLLRTLTATSPHSTQDRARLTGCAPVDGRSACQFLSRIGCEGGGLLALWAAARR